MNKSFTYKHFHSYAKMIFNCLEQDIRGISYESDILTIPKYKHYLEAIDPIFKANEPLNKVTYASLSELKDISEYIFDIRLEWRNHHANALDHNKKFDIITFYIWDRYNQHPSFGDAISIVEQLCLHAMDLMQFKKLKSPARGVLMSYISHDNYLQLSDFTCIETLEHIPL
ncbi:hypothetical protein [Bartonella sp. HY406]|uniref:hypothetical protein n=1 Tax=Bartonella sp. HY406 TaxID=2979331 RepID=UPI0021CA5332|nr:hypothetical protein [Bartonella sp. HY406]UXN03572.1 hypothetical protein N6B01_00505 [Bartonella sp. HY406]